MVDAIKSFFTTGQMRNALIQIEDQLVHSNWMPDLIISINRGGCIPGVYLSHRMKKPHEVVDIRLRDHQTKPNLSVLEKAYAFQKKILIIDDINDTGQTFKYIEDNFGKGKGRIKFAAMVNNLFACKDTLVSPFNRKIFVSLTKEELQKKFS